MTVGSLLEGLLRKQTLNKAGSFDKHCQVMGFMFPFLRLPLANRCYTKTTGLRSTVAWAMGSLTQIKVVTHTRVLGDCCCIVYKTIIFIIT